jgi:NAD(P)H-hydrate repair Nnr-like enzyme with NAD(P)H-hydrate epimerase domain
MVEAWTAAQIREAERPHLEAGETLMRRAADGLADVVREMVRASSRSRDGRAGRVLLLVGSGNNGGDTLYAGESLARELVPQGGAVTVVPVGSRMHEAALAAALAAGAVLDDVDAWCDPAVVAAALPAYDVVLDGLVGTGSDGVGLRGDALRVVQAVLPVVGGATRGSGERTAAAPGSAGAALAPGERTAAASASGTAQPPTPGTAQPGTGEGTNAGAGSHPGRGAASAGAPAARAPRVVAVDVPSGIGVDDGALPDPPFVLPADVTVTFGGHKVGLLVGPGAERVGRIVLVDIGIGADLARMPPAVSSS